MNSLYDVFRAAVDVQDACNLQAVVKLLDRITTYLRSAPDCTGTDFINKHPAVRLVVNKLAHLSGIGNEFALTHFDEDYAAALGYVAEHDQKTKIGGMATI